MCMCAFTCASWKSSCDHEDEKPLLFPSSLPSVLRGNGGWDQSMTVHAANTQIVFNMVEQRWKGRLRNGGQEGEELGKSWCAFIWIWNQLERCGAISSSVLRELFIRMTFTLRGREGRVGRQKGERKEEILTERWNGVSGEMDKWHKSKTE